MFLKFIRTAAKGSRSYNMVDLLPTNDEIREYSFGRRQETSDNVFYVF